jgi:putative ABC transport system permease protein
MKFSRLVIANLLRNKLRTILTVLSVLVAFFLFGTLRTVITTLDAAMEVGSEARLVASNASGITFVLPQSYAQRLETFEGVRSVSWANWFGGYYQDPQDFFAQFAIDPETYLAMYPEVVVPDDQKQAFLAERTAALVGQGLMEKYGWRVGQTVTLKGTIFTGDWDFVVRAVYTPENPSFSDEAMYFHYDYLYEGTNRGISPGWFILQLEDPESAAVISERIDMAFENSTAPTKTETEKAFQTGFVTMWGNVGFLMRAIGTAVFFAILLIAANTMMMSARERVGEVAVLKTLGFQNGTLLALVLAESVTIALVGGTIGLGITTSLFTGSTPLDSFLPGFRVTSSTLMFGFLAALGLGVVSGAVPAFQAARLSVVQALRRVA